VCPLTFWWYDETFNPCRKMQSTGSDALMIGLTLLEAQDLSDVGDEDFDISMVGLDIVSTATILMAGLNEIPPPDILIRGDFIGRLWSIRPLMTPKPFDPQGISIQTIPGIWALCSPIVSPQTPCTCWHAALQLGYEIHKSWSESRDEATFANISNFTHNSIFVLRPDDLSTTAPILITEGGGSIQLIPRSIGDMGLCFVGWPAQYNCTDPNYVWTFPSEIYPGGACLPCPAGTIAPTHSSVKCSPISNINPLCKMGTYKTYARDLSSYVCKTCPSDTYSISQGAVGCLPKVVVRCPPNFYVKDGGPASENSCIPCVPCAVDSVMIPFSLNPCPGNTRSQPYVCVAWLKGIPGFFAYAGLDNSNNPAVKYSPCIDLPAYAVWDNGPNHDLCYFRCKYGVNEDMVREYAFYFALTSPENEKRWPGGSDKNLFPFAQPYSKTLNTATVTAICTNCNTSRCPEDMWRPLWADGCGPPCLLSPSLCQGGRSDGCVAICDVPENAVVLALGTDANGRAACTWRCNVGWIKINGLCMGCNASLCQPGQYYVGNSQCNPDMLLSQICIPCPNTVLGGVLYEGEPGKCSYKCLDGFYENPNPLSQVACIQCTGTVTRCPAGFSVTCALEPCKSCLNPNILGGKAVLVPTSDSICRVQCKPGFHTISILDYSVISSTANDPSKILCEECFNRPTIPCPTTSCNFGYQPSGSLCIPCQKSADMGCPEGTYAPPCPGGRVTQMVGCLTCPMNSLLIIAAIDDYVPGQWPTRKFVGSGGGSVIVNNINNDCSTACVDGSVQVKRSTGIVCVACSKLLPDPPSNAPYSKYSSMWNASDGVRWWPAEFDPPHLAPRPTWTMFAMEKRAGICWPCPNLPQINGDPCFTTSTEPPPRGGVVSSNTISITDQQPWVMDSGPLRRRLLSSSTTQEFCSQGNYPVPPLGAWCAVCPVDHYCVGGQSQPIRCRAFSTSNYGSKSAQNCTCRPGFAFKDNDDSECTLIINKFDCPPGFYKAPTTIRKGGPQCIPCPAGTREQNGQCHSCPLQSSSAEGSTTCKCQGSQCNEIIECPQGSSLDLISSDCKACSALPLPNVFSPSCTSCGPGTYLSDKNVCLPCPKGTFSQKTGSAPCTPCPEKMTTLYVGSTTLSSCLF
jgi:hypothetical protein